MSAPRALDRVGMSTYHYRRRIRTSAAEDLGEIITGFRDLIAGGTNAGLKLLNYYKGLPICYPATPVELHGNILELDVHLQQAVALETSRHTFIKCSRFGHSLRAEVKDVDVRRMTASLHRFSYVEIMADQRGSLRLDLEPPCDAEILADGGSIAGKVLDISLGGFAMTPSACCDLGRGEEVKIRIMVPNLVQNSHFTLELDATVVTAAGEGSGEIFRFSFSSDPRVEGIISRFIFQRQVDLIRELKEHSGR